MYSITLTSSATSQNALAAFSPHRRQRQHSDTHVGYGTGVVGEEWGVEVEWIERLWSILNIWWRFGVREWVVEVEVGEGVELELGVVRVREVEAAGVRPVVWLLFGLFSEGVCGDVGVSEC